MRERKIREYSLKIQNLNEKGYGVGYVDGRVIWVLNALPGEEVVAVEFKRRRGISLAVAKEVVKKSQFRLEEKEDHFLACSPWQILQIEEENKVKKELIYGFFRNLAKIDVSDFEVAFGGSEYGYRNKLEFSFYGKEDNSLAFAYHKREGGKGKYQFETCALAPEKVNKTNQKILNYLNSKKFTSRQLKGIQNRYSFSEDNVVSTIYTKDPQIILNPEELSGLLDDDLKGLQFIYSNHQSPAFIDTEVLFSFGETDIKEKILDLEFTYPFDSFFQINPQVFEFAVRDIVEYIKQTSTQSSPLAKGEEAKISSDFKKDYKVETKDCRLIDLYSGVGTLGLLVSKYVQNVTCIELFDKSKKYGQKNIQDNNISNVQFIQAKAEDALEPIEDADIVIVDPPRIGLHEKVLNKLKEAKPKKIIYLSCNPQTQAINLNELKDFYKIKFFKAYNFYPHTPHVESLMILELI